MLIKKRAWQSGKAKLVYVCNAVFVYRSISLCVYATLVYRSISLCVYATLVYRSISLCVYAIFVYLSTSLCVASCALLRTTEKFNPQPGKPDATMSLDLMGISV